jgi:transcriptional regulator of acetoin/glycerol metabolism
VDNQTRFRKDFANRQKLSALAATNGNVTAAAKKLGISRRTLHRKINEMNLPKPKANRGSAS